MINLTKEQEKKYKELAEEHADFLCEKVFKPAFKMAFLHGAKHMQEEMMTGAFHTEIEAHVGPKKN